MMTQKMTEQITEQFPGKKQARGVHIDIGENGIILDVYLMVHYGHAIPEVAVKVQESVANAIASMAGFNVTAVNVHIGGICFN